MLAMITLSWQHEIWRDEMRALNLVIDSHSIQEILTNQEAEGHPALWYPMLYFSYHLLQTPLILKINISRKRL
jgi:hypothetical protein